MPTSIYIFPPKKAQNPGLGRRGEGGSRSVRVCKQASACTQVSTGTDEASLLGLQANSWQLLLSPASLYSPLRPGPPFICLVKRPIETHLSVLRFTALVVNSLGAPALPSAAALSVSGCLPPVRSLASSVQAWSQWGEIQEKKKKESNLKVG